jgi:hypothetical protein
MMYAVLTVIDHVKGAVKEQVEKEGKQILEVELYLKWLEGFNFVLDAVEVSYVLWRPLPSTKPSPPLRSLA